MAESCEGDNVIPKYPFQVRGTSDRPGAPNGMHQQTKSFEEIPAAVAFMAAMARNPTTSRLELLSILEDQTVNEEVAVAFR